MLPADDYSATVVNGVAPNGYALGLTFGPNKEGFGPELPIEERVSAPFTIQVP